VQDHLDSLEALWLRQQERIFATRLCSPDPAAEKRRYDAHFAGLMLRKEEAVHEAALRLQSVHLSKCVVAAQALLKLAPEQCLGPTGEVLLRARRPLAVVEALAESGVIAIRPSIGDAISIEACSARAEIPEGMLVAPPMVPIWVQPIEEILMFTVAL
jgi:hypothetical protein